MNRAAAVIAVQLVQDYEVTADNVLSQPAEAESWSDIRRNVLYRMRIASVGQVKAEDIAAYMQEIADALAEELAGR